MSLEVVPLTSIVPTMESAEWNKESLLISHEVEKRTQHFRIALLRPLTLAKTSDLCNRASPHPKKEEEGDVTDHWELVRANKKKLSESDAKLRRKHEALGETWDFIETHLPRWASSLREVDANALALIPNEFRIAPANIHTARQLCRDEMRAMLFGKNALDVPKENLKALFLECIKQVDASSALVQKILREKIPEYSTRVFLQKFAELFPLAFGMAIDAVYKPVKKDRGHITPGWQQRVDEEGHKVTTGPLTVFYALQEKRGAGGSFVFDKYMQALKGGTLPYLEWNIEGGQRTWDLNDKDANGQRSMQILFKQVDIDIQKKEICNPCAGLVLAAAGSPDVVEAMKRKMSLKQGAKKRPMTSTQAPGLAHMFRERLLSGEFIQAVEKHVH